MSAWHPPAGLVNCWHCPQGGLAGTARSLFWDQASYIAGWCKATVPDMCSMPQAPGSASRQAGLFLIRRYLEIGCYQQPASKYCCFWEPWEPFLMSRRSVGLWGRWHMRAAPKHPPWEFIWGVQRGPEQKEMWRRHHGGSADLEAVPAVVLHPPLMGRHVKTCFTSPTWC